jgi:hypothetical protein
MQFGADDGKLPAHNPGAHDPGTGASWDHYDVGVSGRYQELANTSWPAYKLGGYAEKSRGGWTAHQISDVPIPAHGAVVLVRWDEESRTAPCRGQVMMD